MHPPRSLAELTRRNIEAILKMERASHQHRTFGERVADGVTAAVGSWPFLIIQSMLLAVWVVLNVVAWTHQWDPYPFILLNLVLSFQAAYTSPIILMSQNRQSRIGELRNHLDLQINILAEQEATEMLHLLRKLCEKLDVSLQDDEAALRALEQATRPEQLVRQMEKRIQTGEKDEDPGRVTGS
jgi:uncharacterized membrane protein